jgi:LPXTG-site transpeptidase (sortase) family protein
MARKFKKKIYIKDTSNYPVYKSVNKKFTFKTRILPFFMIFVGSFVLVSQVLLPLVYFKTQSKTSNKPMEGSVLGMASGFSNFEFDELKNGAEKQGANPNLPDFFYITIPKLKIENARIEVNSTDLSPDDTLGHYNGSNLPGENGNTFIYGHSVLPWFYNPKNYKTIFSTLGDLEKGDEFTIVYNNKKYDYMVESQEVKYPDEIDPLAEWKPKYLNESTVVLMTCWPAGAKTKRLMINATLEN